MILRFIFVKNDLLRYQFLNKNLNISGTKEAEDINSLKENTVLVLLESKAKDFQIGINYFSIHMLSAVKSLAYLISLLLNTEAKFAMLGNPNIYLALLCNPTLELKFD